MLRRNLRLAVAIVFGFACSASAAAPSKLIDVDFNGANNDAGGPTATGAAVIGSAGDTWNGLPSSPGGPTALVASNGLASGASISWNSTGSWDGGGSPSPNPALTQDYLYETGTGTVSLSGLAPGGQYQLYIYTQNNDSNSRRGTYTVGSTSMTSGDGSQGLTTWVPGENYAEFAFVEANNLGQLTISFAPTPGFAGEAEFDGLQLMTITPEPSSIVAICGLGAMGLFVLARRRLHRRSKSCPTAA